MKTFIFFILLNIFTTHGFALEVCDTAVEPEDRIDCHPVVTTQAACEEASCVWCSAVAANVPHCFLNVTASFHVLHKAARHCRSVYDCDVAINCHPDKITYQPNQASCESRGCLWLGNYAVNDRPRCVFYNNTIIGNNLLLGGAFPLVEIAMSCTSCDSCTYKLDCLPNEQGARVNERRCQREGCIWCADTGKCITSSSSALDTMGPQCNSCTTCPTQAYIKSMSKEECLKKKGTYCINRESSPDDRRCIIIGDSTQEACSLHKAMAGKCKSCDNCEEPLDCSAGAFYENEISCFEKGCMWCHSNETGPHCRYGSSGYRCISEEFCDVQFPRFQNIEWKLQSYQRPHLYRLMKVLCYSQLGVWAPSSSDKCLSASPLAMGPLMRKVSTLHRYYHYMHYYRYHLVNSILPEDSMDITYL